MMTKVPKVIRDLVEQFERNLSAYKSTGYKEDQLKEEFLNKFFKALGWDVYNESGVAPQYRDVIFQDSIKVGGGTKAPDYCFTLSGRRMFFVEAKKPSVDIKKDIHPAFQLRRYAWSAKLSLSILTDFEEFAVYESRTRPKKEDKASTERIMYLTYKDYIDKWDEIYGIFSYDAVRQGSFDRFIETTKKKRGTQEVDDEFLNEIETWRDMFARNIAIRNPDLSVRDLNFSVQRTIDRIIFLRMCEDRGIERYGQLNSLVDSENIYNRLCEIYKKADEKYNSGLFQFKKEKGRTTLPDELTLNLNIDDNVLKTIIKNLYYPDSPYEFSVLAPEILGNVYEQFLGKVIYLTQSHRAKVEEKPEVKKAGGVYYTPQYIVEYIVKNTVGKLCKGKTPKQISKLRILDPACGSGSFLLGTYTYLLKYHLDYYTKKKNLQRYKEQIYPGRGGMWFLTIKEKKRILLNNIYGVDIDSQAVEVTKLSLLLKVLEGESKDVFEKQQKLWRERALPDLGNNIKCGNSLIGPDFYNGVQTKLFEDEEIHRINIFDWDKEFKEIMDNDRFDVVIGNPPYIQIQKLKEFYPEEIEFYKKKYETAREKNVDIYIPFIERSLSLLKKKGVLGFICPNRFFNSDYGDNLREFIKNYNLYHLVNFRHYFVFEKSDTYTCLLFLQNKKQQKELIYKEIRDLYGDKDEQITYFLNSAKESEEHFVIDKLEPHFISQDKWYFMTEDENKIFEKIIRHRKFSDCYDLNFQGLITGVDSIYILKLIKDEGKTKIFFSKALNKEVELESAITFNIVGDSDIDRFYIKKTCDYIIFPYKNGELMDSNKLQKYPLVWDYLNLFKEKLKEREKGKFNNKYWYQFSRNQAIDKQTLAKILIPHVVKKTRTAFDVEGKKFIKNVGVNGVVLKNEMEEDYKYFLAVLNSRLSTFFISKTSIFLSGGFYATNKQFAGEIPIKKIDFTNTKQKANHDKIVKLVERMLDVHKKLAKAKSPNEKQIIQRQIDATDHQIDLLVYELYGLTEGEIDIIKKGK